MNIPIEIERKFVIAMPDFDKLSSVDGYTSSEIEQTYLSAAPGVTRRIRARSCGKDTVYTETKKIRVDKISAYEDERRIDELEYRRLLSEILPGTVTLHKTRHTFPYRDRIFEIDVYPEWQMSCILEVELDSHDAVLTFPPFLTVIKEVSGDKSYSNASMSRRFPDELL